MVLKICDFFFFFLWMTYQILEERVKKHLVSALFLVRNCIVNFQG